MHVPALRNRARLVPHQRDQHGGGDTAVDHPRRERVPYRVETDVLEVGLFGGSFESAAGGVAVLEWLAVAGSEDRVVVAPCSAPGPPRATTCRRASAPTGRTP
jgi:hypothetical protein